MLSGIEGQGIIENCDSVYKTGIPYVATELLLYLGRDEGKEPEPTYLNFSYQPMYDTEMKLMGCLSSDMK